MGRTKKRRVTRASRAERTGPLSERRCRCRLHEYDMDLSKRSDMSMVKLRMYSTSAKDFKLRNLHWLISEGHMSSRNKIVCSLCLNYAEEMMLKQEQRAARPTTPTSPPASPLPSTSHTDTGSLVQDTPQPVPSTSCREGKIYNDRTGSSSSDTSDDIVDDIVAKIESGRIRQQDIRKLAHAIGGSLSSVIFTDSKDLHSVYSNLETLGSLNCRDFLNMRPAPLIDFILGAASVSIDNPHDESKLLALCTAVEDIYKARNGQFVGPLSFGSGVIKWSMCGSKTAHSLDGASGAGGSINTLRTFFKASSNEPNECYSRDVEIFSDNTQRTGKTVRVREDGTTPLGVATNVVFIQSNPPTDLQSRRDLKPSEWPSKRDDETMDEITKLEAHLNEDYFRPYRIEFQDDVLKEVKEEIKFDGTQATDHVDLLDSAPEDSSVCTKCSEIFPKDVSICPKCSNKRRNISDRIVLYGEIPSMHPAAKPSVKMGEVIGVNPNSKDTLKCVVDNLSKQCGIGEGREWVRLGFDGVPYRIIDNIIKETVVCEVCGEEIDIGKTPFSTHVDQNHPDMMDVGHRLLFGHILLVPGAGHIEKNFLIVTFRMCRYIFLEYLADCLGFKTKRAKDFAVGCSNHHIAWQMLIISLGAFARELMYHYILDCNKQGKDATINNFVPWRNSVVKNPNYNMMFDLTFNVLMALKMYRSGIRRNHSECALAARQKIAPLMYLGKHAIYQQLLMSDMRNRVNAPGEVKAYMARNEAFSRSGDHTRGEGGDYVTEAENRTLKSHLPPGIPTEASWRVASRLDRHLKKLRQSVFNRACLRDPNDEKTSTFNFEEEIQMFRSKIRLSGMLNTPRVAVPLRSITGKELDKDLVNFYFTACESYASYKSGDPSVCKQIFVTPEDRSTFNKIENKTIKEIESQITDIISMFPDQQKAEDNRSLMKTTLASGRGKKADYVSFYLDMKAELDQQLAESTISEDTDMAE